jgi:hypothetical protein
MQAEASNLQMMVGRQQTGLATVVLHPLLACLGFLQLDCED